MGKNFELTSLSEVFALLAELVAGGWSSDRFFSLEGGLKNRSVLPDRQQMHFLRRSVYLHHLQISILVKHEQLRKTKTKIQH